MTAPTRSAPALATVHAFLPSTPLDTVDGPRRVDALRCGMRLRGRTGWVALAEVAVVRPSAAACTARPALRAFTLDPDALAPGLPAAPVQVAAGTPFLLDLGGGETVTLRGLDLARAGVGRLGPAHRPVPLRRLRLERADAVLAGGVWVAAAPLPDPPPLPRDRIAGLDAEAIGRGLRRANAAAVLRGLCAAPGPVAA
ncbi:Hint domain-containing protein [Jannaschia sp. Os4]|uniref:Hint domain-containing protein n=1 Tax=Jannaschia sp. Os4 TaxID=2807617 RepID=UPI00193998DF|nr:Hint domain-containing protein [Jannaschia sp. Os4]MBM2576791.1 Hint domain-containing protein [Jannaschia sp. Os4]